MTVSSEHTSDSIGERFRRRRKALQFTLQDVASATELTPGYLSQVERGQVRASVSALQRICSVLKIPVGSLFDSEQRLSNPVMRYLDSSPQKFGNGASKIKLTPTSFDHLEVLLGTFEPGGDTGDEPYTHGSSEEVLVVVEGHVVVYLGGVEHELGPCDSLRYHSDESHRVREATGTAHAKVLWTMAPPTY